MSNISNISNIFIYLAKENIYLFIYLFQKVQIIFRYISTQGCLGMTTFQHYFSGFSD